MNQRQNNREVGASHEQQAGAFLRQKGYRILTYNYRCRIGEIDIIAKDGRYLVFVEVKYRKQVSQGHPAEAVTLAKQRKISKVADYYCMMHGLLDGTPCRFDVISILGDDVELIQNAFEYCGS